MKIEEKIKNLIIEALKKLGIDERRIELDHPANLANGDFSTNIAMVLAKKIKKNPEELAEKIVEKIRVNLPREISKIELARPGFINFYLSQEFFIASIDEILKQGKNFGKNKFLVGKKIIVEYTQPNPFKPFHIGHLMSNAIGESISRVVEFSGAKIVRANYQGDIGPHIAKAIYGLLKFGMPDEHLSVSEKAHYIGEMYAKGNDLYEKEVEAKKEIEEINKKIYSKEDKKINKIYTWGKKITLEAFEEIYKILGTKFDKYYFESEMAPIGQRIVENNVRPVLYKDNHYEKLGSGIFRKSDGAIVFDASHHHTRVFINSHGLPTYEAKEIGLSLTKFKRCLFQRKLSQSIVITASEQDDYMKVVEEAIYKIRPNFKGRMKHISHGMMRLASGENQSGAKMSSRKGNVITGESLLEDATKIIFEKVKAREFSEEEKKKISEMVGVSALKYSILRSAIGSNIVFDFDKSISFEGDSGPYLQYTAVRANSILEKEKNWNPGPTTHSQPWKGKAEVIDLEHLLYKFPEIIERSYQEFAPHYIATYLTELASAFNAFYGSTQILDVGNKNMEHQLKLTKAFSQTMQNGLWLIGIQVPEKM